jgi:hypothetical protein
VKCAAAACAWLCVAAPAAAQTAPACPAAEHRQFDFWIGRWDVFEPSGRKAGENTIERIAEGCALLESWTGTSGLTGKSLNMYDATDRRWHQTWVDSSGSRLELVGELAGGRMRLASRGPHPKRPGATLEQRITWTPNADGSVRQLWEQSEDGGANWAVVFDGRYVRRAPANR